MRSPRKKNGRRGYEKTDIESQRAMDRLLNESDLLDSRLKMQLQYIQEIRRDTLDAISNSEQVINKYDSAHKEFNEKMENKKYEHLGNEKFMKGVIKKDVERRRESESSKNTITEATEVWNSRRKNIGVTQSSMSIRNKSELEEISEHIIRKNY